MKLGERRKLGDKEYAAVYEGYMNCKRCAFSFLNSNGLCVKTGNECLANENGRLQQIVWIEVKK